MTSMSRNRFWFPPIWKPKSKKNAFPLWQLTLLMIFVQDEHLNERQGLVIAPTQGFLPTRLRRLVLTLQKFHLNYFTFSHNTLLSTQSPLSFCELLIVGFPSKWTIRWCSLVPLPSQPLLVTMFFAFVLSFPISYLLAKSEAMSLVLGRAHSIPGVIKIRGMSAITIDKAYKSIHMF